IEDRLADPGLTAAQVAAATGISERHLSRIFAADGTSIPRHVLARRLQLAYAMLADSARADPARASQARAEPPSAGLTVADVAARCGFTSAAHFSHAFRQHFGQRAGEVRRQALAARAAAA
ncbi:MAG TPA: helix-turn-helix transcriptional regulator, partial [Streptosporangiaceae bacterium]|nr:helix-turn-helix transcriptional regulator [Streptosporangiaceae bacterium]